MRWLADLLFPETCVGCGVLTRGGLCRGCLDALPALGPPCCDRCGVPTVLPVQACRECRGRGYRFDRARQAVAFDPTARAAIHRLKYRGEWSLAEVLAGLAVRAVGLLPAGSAFEAAAWPPAGRRRLAERGVDHAALLARAVAGVLGIGAVPLLERVRETPPQVGLTPAVRRRNLREAFACPEGAPARVLVVDDVFTTGATCSEAARALRRAGAREVVCVAVARVLPAARSAPGARPPGPRGSRGP